MSSSLSLYRQYLRFARDFPLSPPFRDKLATNIRVAFQLRKCEENVEAIARYQEQGVFDLQLLRRMQAHDPETLKLLFRKGEA